MPTGLYARAAHRAKVPAFGNDPSRGQPTMLFAKQNVKRLKISVCVP
jgi:hypothetical protein